MSNSWKSRTLDILKTVIVPLAVVFLTEALYKQPLYDESLKLAPELQKYEEWKPFMKTVSGLGTGRAYACFLVVTFNSIPKPASLFFWCGIAFANFTMNQLKSFYGEPRPYWVSDEIKADHCGTGFGNPSGHMLNNCFFWGIAYLHLFYDVTAPRP